MQKKVCPTIDITSTSLSLLPTTEAFLLFSQHIPADNLGFIDSRATSVEVTIRDNEYTIHQSPTLLSSSRAGGTTGAGTSASPTFILRRKIPDA